MEHKLISRTLAACATALVLVASTASAQDRHTAKVVNNPQGEYHVGIELRVEPVSGHITGNQVTLNYDGHLNVMWFSRELLCNGSEVHSDLRSRFTVPEQADLTCHPPEGVSPDHAGGITAVRARMRANQAGAMLANGTYTFAYNGSVVKSTSLNVTVVPEPLTFESPELQDALQSAGSYSGRRYTLSAGYNPYFTRPDTHGLQLQFAYALADPMKSRIVPELGAHLGWATTTLPIKEGARNIVIGDEDARMYTYSAAAMLNGVVSMYDTSGGWHGEFLFGAMPGLRVHSSVKEVVAQLPNGAVIWDDQVTRYSFLLAGQVGFRLGYEGIFLSPVVMAEVTEEPYASGDGMNTEWRGNLAGGFSLGLQFPWQKKSSNEEEK